MMIKKCLLAGLLLGMAGAGVFAQSTVTLNEAIRRGADGISGALPRGTKIAVLNFSSSSGKLSDYVVEETNDALVSKGALMVVDRQNLESIRKEIRFNDSGEVSNSSAQQVGRMLGAQVIVSGSLTMVNGNYRFRIQALEVETAAIKYSEPFIIKNDKLLTDLMPAPSSTSTSSSRFTVGDAIALNLLFGYGSFKQRDYTGCATIIVLEGFGILSGVYALLESDPQTKKNAATGCAVLYGAGLLVGIFAPLLFDAGFYAAADHQPPFAVALVPAHNGSTAMQVSYTYHY